MDYFGEFPVFARSSSPPVPEDALLSSPGTETEAPALPLVVSYDQNASYPTYATSRRDFHGPQLHWQLEGPSSLATGSEASILHPQAFPPAAVHSTWRDPPSKTDYAMPSPFSSAQSMYHIPQASAVVADRARYTPHERERVKIRLIFPVPKICAPSHGQAAQPVSPSHPEHVTQWYLVQSDAVIINGPRQFVPQTIYQPGYAGDRKRYVSLAKLHPPIIFAAEGSSEWGLPIPDLLSGGSTRVAGGNEPAFTSCGPSIGIRMQWPGYQPCHKQVSTKDYTPKRCMINKARLARLVAKCISVFMDTMSRQEMKEGSDRQWEVGPSGIGVDEIILVSLHHVSQGSWQPQLRLRRPVGTSITAGQYVHEGGEMTRETWE